MRSILLPLLKEIISIIQCGRGNILIRCNQESLQRMLLHMQKAIYIQKRGKFYKYP